MKNGAKKDCVFRRFVPIMEVVEIKRLSGEGRGLPPLQKEPAMKNASESPHLLWYRAPAPDWNSALPLGSGTLGMMVFGGTAREELQLNEESLWSGFPGDWDAPECREALPEMRRLLFDRELRRAEALCKERLVCRGRGSDDPYYGSFQTAGSLILEAPAEDVSGYVRLLDLRAARAETRFGPICRVHTVSHRYQVTASRVTGQSCLRLTFEREDCSVAYRGAEIVVTGRNPGPGAVGFCTVVRVETDGAVSPSGDSLAVSGARTVTIYTCTATTYRADEDPERVCRRRIDKAAGAGFDAVLEDEAAFAGEAMGRCTLTLEDDPLLASLTTDRRLARVQEGGTDIGLVRLWFEFGKYLFLCSAPGRLPANLQGVWSKDMWTPWTGDYHLNINLQMNYWPMEALGFAGLGENLWAYLRFLREHGTRTARVMYGCRGWVAHTLSNPWGFTAPGQDPDWGAFLCGGAWCCRHIWEHWLYTGDLAFLRENWPVLRDAALFFTDFLAEDPKTGYLVTAPSNSPENSYIDPEDGGKIAVTPGPAMDSQIVRELFSHTLEAAKVLGAEDGLTDKIARLLPRLPPVKISRYGTVQEWLEDYEEWEPGHRHISQLYGLYPGSEIDPDATPELARAAEETLRRRLSHGGGHTGWSRAWIVSFYARLRDGAEAERHLYALLRKSTLPNLFDTHPPFQIDGNFGGTAGILECLVQSHAGALRLLPALPPDWQSGRLDGVRVRGGLTVSFGWKKGKVTELSIVSPDDRDAVLVYNGGKRTVHLRAGENSVEGSHV